MPVGAANDGFDPIRSWQHSFAVAMLCERLASIPEKPGQGDAAIAYMVGLCHDLGEILFRTCFGEEYQHVLDEHARTGQPVADLEKAILGLPSSELMQLTLRSLQLPDAIRLPIEAMHDSAPSQDRLCLILGLADAYANGMQLASSVKSPLRSFTTAECQHALGNPNGPKLDRERIRAEIFALTALLSNTNDPRLAKPLFKFRNDKVWLARDAGLSKLDPIEAALESVSPVQVMHRLPTMDEAGKIKALVVDSISASDGLLSAQNLDEWRTNLKLDLPMLWLVHDHVKAAAEMNHGPDRPIKMPVPLETLANLLAA